MAKLTQRHNSRGTHYNRIDSGNAGRPITAQLISERISMVLPPLTFRIVQHSIDALSLFQKLPSECARICGGVIDQIVGLTVIN